MEKFQYPPIEFDCRHCGKHVITEGRHENGKPDKRTVFCCRACEIKYWKHAYRLKNRGVTA